MIDLLQRVVAGLMSRVRVNQIQQIITDGRPVFVKRRRAGSGMVIWLGNRFLQLAHSGICMLVRADEWLDWEVHCSRLLYPTVTAVKVGPGQTLFIPQMHGLSLRQLVRREESSGDLTTVKALVLAARELRRAHQLPCSHYQGGWSHGDLHLDNIICDLDADRATLIDFDTRHEFGIGQTQRHADDLKVVLLELIGLPDEKWCRRATAFIEEYGESSVLHELSRQLSIPHGFARVLWYTRTNCASIRQIEPRLQSLREIIHRVCSTSNTSSRIQLCCDRT